MSRDRILAHSCAVIDHFCLHPGHAPAGAARRPAPPVQHVVCLPRPPDTTRPTAPGRVGVLGLRWTAGHWPAPNRDQSLYYGQRHTSIRRYFTWHHAGALREAPGAPPDQRPAPPRRSDRRPDLAARSMVPAHCQCPGHSVWLVLCGPGSRR